MMVAQSANVEQSTVTDPAVSSGTHCGSNTVAPCYQSKETTLADGLRTQDPHRRG